MIVKAVAQYVEYGRDRFDYKIIFASRKSLQITVHPNQSILVKAPLDTDMEAIHNRILKRGRWIRKQVQYFQQFDLRGSKRFYVIGETHLYLGKRYRLSHTKSNETKVVLEHGRLHVFGHSPDPAGIKKQLVKWYRLKAQMYYQAIFEQCWEQFERYGHDKPEIRIRKMVSRWGSLSRSGALTLNADLIKAPKECIEYVILHELCHLEHYNHSSEFYNLLESHLPDWTRRKLKLELALI